MIEDNSVIEGRTIKTKIYFEIFEIFLKICEFFIEF